MASRKKHAVDDRSRLEALAQQAESDYMGMFQRDDEPNDAGPDPYTFSFQTIVEPYQRNRVNVQKFMKSYKTVERLFSDEFGDSNLFSMVSRGYRRMMRSFGYKQPTLPDAMKNHLHMTRGLFMEFGFIVRTCEHHRDELLKYHGSLSERVKGDTTTCDSFGQGNNISKAVAKRLEDARKDASGAMDTVNYELGMFYAELSQQDASNQRMLAKRSFRNDNGNAKLIRTEIKILGNVVAHCQGIYGDLKSLQEHLEVVLPNYINGMYVARAARDMERTLDKLGCLTNKVFESYQKGLGDINQLFYRQPHAMIFRDFEGSLKGMEQQGAIGLHSYNDSLTSDLASQGYKFR